MYYAKRKMISYLDPRLLSFYQETDPVLAVEKLRKLGINYIFMPDYTLPPAYNSSLLAILSNPTLSRLDYQVGMAQLYELVDSQKKLGEIIDFTPGPGRLWNRSTQILLGGRKAIDSLSFVPNRFEGGESRSWMPLFHRDYSVLLESQAPLSVEDTYDLADRLQVINPGEYLFRARLLGRGYITLWLTQYDAGGQPVYNSTFRQGENWRLGDLSLTSKGSMLNFERRIKIDKNTRYVKFGVQHNGKSHIVIEEIQLQSIIKR
jgi:hypothetical protein